MHDPEHFEPLVSVLTGGRDRHYTLGLASALAENGINLDFIGSDDLECEKLRQSPRVRFLNLRGDQSGGASILKKVFRVLAYYVRLLNYAARSRAKIFHILWNNKVEFFDRTLLMVFYKMRGKKVALTAHNVNAGQRDGYDSRVNRATLKIQYRLCDRIFVHTEKMRAELMEEFGVPAEKAVLIPYGWNNMVPTTALTGLEARQRLGLSATDKVILFYGHLAPYKGLEFLVEAFEMAANEDPSLRLVIAGRPRPQEYWQRVEAKIRASRHGGRILQRVEFVAESDTEIYFKAADVLALPYVY
ncbi:MAG: glycosyltransferase family 4 protein, partial [Limisphaerales bacterium]